MSVKAENSESEAKLADEWLIRPCSLYKDEYADCTTVRARFHQYFIYGETIDCSQWKRDHMNCEKWEDTKDNKAGMELIKSEKARRLVRLKGHYGNTVWEKRELPPDDWAKPLPEAFQKEYKNSYLYLKSKEMEKDPLENLNANRTLCVIM